MHNFTPDLVANCQHFPYAHHQVPAEQWNSKFSFSETKDESKAPKSTHHQQRHSLSLHMNNHSCEKFEEDEQKQ